MAQALNEQAAQAGVDTCLVVGGLRRGSSVLDASTRRYILDHWQAVSEATGQPFAFEGALPDGFVYDTEPACRALVAARELDASRLWPLLALIQGAFYQAGTDITRARRRPMAKTSSSANRWSNWEPSCWKPGSRLKMPLNTFCTAVMRWPMAIRPPSFWRR